MANAYTEANRLEREHIGRLTKSLSDADYARSAGGPGWTVGGILAHLAFWDLRVPVIFDVWKRKGMGPSPMDTDVVNASMKEICIAVPPRAVAALVISAAASADAAVDALEPEMIARMEKEPRPVRLDRAAHRRHHLGQIEKTVGR